MGDLTPLEDSHIEESLTSIREAVRRQLGVDRPLAANVDATTQVRFRSDLEENLTSKRRRELVSQAADLDPWLQGPFYLGGDLIVGGTWRCDQRWVSLGREVPQILTGKRVLDIGSNAGYDPFMFALRGADEVIACEPFGFHEQAIFLEVDLSLWRSLQEDRLATN